MSLQNYYYFFNHTIPSELFYYFPNEPVLVRAQTFCQKQNAPLQQLQTVHKTKK